MRGLVSRSRPLFRKVPAITEAVSAKDSTKPVWHQSPRRTHKVFHFLNQNGPQTRKTIFEEFEKNFKNKAALNGVLKTLIERRHIRAKGGKKEGKRKQHWVYYIRRDKRPILTVNEFIANGGKAKSDEKWQYRWDKKMTRLQDRKKQWSGYLLGDKKQKFCALEHETPSTLVWQPGEVKVWGKDGNIL